MAWADDNQKDPLQDKFFIWLFFILFWLVILGFIFWIVIAGINKDQEANNSVNEPIKEICQKAGETRCKYLSSTEGGPALWSQQCPYKGGAWTNFEECLDQCKYGSCVKSEKVVESTCEDSDNGQDYFIKGFIKTTEQGPFWDVCDFSTEGAVNEYSCNRSGNGYTVTTFQCTNGCKNGACIRDKKIDCDKYEVLHINYGVPSYKSINQEWKVAKVSELTKEANSMSLKEMYDKFKTTVPLEYNTLDSDPFQKDMYGSSGPTQAVLNQYKEDLDREGKVLMTFTNFNYQIIKYNEECE